MVTNPAAHWESRHPCDNVTVGHILGDDGSRCDQRTRSNRYPCKNRGIAANARAFFYKGLHDHPVGLALRCAIRVRCAGMKVIGKHHAVTDEYLILDAYPLANE